MYYVHCTIVCIIGMFTNITYQSVDWCEDCVVHSIALHFDNRTDNASNIVQTETRSKLLRKVDN